MFIIYHYYYEPNVSTCLGGGGLSMGNGICTGRPMRKMPPGLASMSICWASAGRYEGLAWGVGGLSNVHAGDNGGTINIVIIIIIIITIIVHQVNSASYPQRYGKRLVAYGLRGKGPVWLIGAVVCLLAANRESNCSLTRAMDGRIVRCGIISSYHFRDCKALLVASLTHVSSAIAITGRRTFTFTITMWIQRTNTK